MARPVQSALSTLVLALAVVAAVVVAAWPSSSVHAGSCWAPPVVAPVIDPFREPACPWCPGNRGLEYGTGAGIVVRSVTAGRVKFSGLVAEVGYVVVGLADGRRVTYGGVSGSGLSEGDPVVSGARLGITHRNLHLGLRDGDTYLDPAPHLGRLVHRARLVPLDGAEPRPAGAPRLRCAGGGRGAHPAGSAERSGTLLRRLHPSG